MERICPEGEVWVAGELGASAFSGCNSLQSAIKLSNKNIKEYTFSYCKELKVVELPNKTKIEESAFEECESLERICPEGEVWVAGELGASAFSAYSLLRSWDFPSGLLSIEV